MMTNFFDISGMGQMNRIHHIHTLYTFGSALLGSVLTCAGGLALVYAFFDTSVQVARYGPIMVENTVLRPATMAFILFILGSLFILTARNNWKKSVIVFEKGLAYYDNRGIQIWWWADIVWYYVSITTQFTAVQLNKSYRYVLQKNDGSKLTLDGKFEDIELLGNIINRQVNPIQYRKLNQIINSGDLVKLGPILFDKHSISIKNNTYRWENIESIEISDGYAKFGIKGKRWFNKISIPLSVIPNLDPFYAFAKRIIKIKMAFK
jgi:hypothetical protein